MKLDGGRRAANQTSQRYNLDSYSDLEALPALNNIQV